MVKHKNTDIYQTTTYNKFFHEFPLAIGIYNRFSYLKNEVLSSGISIRFLFKYKITYTLAQLSYTKAHIL